MSMLRLMGLCPWTATVTADELTFDGHNLLTMGAKARPQDFSAMIWR